MILHVARLYWIAVRFASSSSKNMVRVLNVAEKNDAAKSISDVMSNGRYKKVSELTLHGKAVSRISLPNGINANGLRVHFISFDGANSEYCPKICRSEFPHPAEAHR